MIRSTGPIPRNPLAVSPLTTIAPRSRTVVAIDPSGTRGDPDKRSDHVGIVVAAKGEDGRAYVLADRTVNLPPEAWSRVAVSSRVRPSSWPMPIRCVCVASDIFHYRFA